MAMRGRRGALAATKIACRPIQSWLMKCSRWVFVGVVFATGAGACSPAGSGKPGSPLISAATTMVTAWEVPKNPLTDSSLDESPLSKQIRWGYQIFVDTPQQATRFAPSKVSCANCHLNAGQRERALPLVGVAGVFPEYNARAGRLISLADRIVECFNRSENGTGRLVSGSDPGAGDEAGEALPSPTSKEVLALSAYITWLANGYPVGQSPAWRGRNNIAENARIPVDRLDARKGQALFLEKCGTCHGATDRACRLATRKQVRCGDPTRGTMARAPLAFTRWRESSGIRCRISIPAA